MAINPQIYSFEAIIQKNPDMDAGYIIIPFDVKKEFGKSRVKVLATFDNVQYQGSLVRMQTPYHIIGVTKAIRKQINKTFSDKIQVRIKERE